MCSHRKYLALNGIGTTYNIQLWTGWRYALMSAMFDASGYWNYNIDGQFRCPVTLHSKLNIVGVRNHRIVWFVFLSAKYKQN